MLECRRGLWVQGESAHLALCGTVAVTGIRTRRSGVGPPHRSTPPLPARAS